MSWASLASNQWVSYTNLQNAVDTGVVTLINSFPSTDRWIDKGTLLSSVNADPTNPYLSPKSSNQWVAKRDVTAPTVYALDISCDGTSSTSACGLSMPCFAFTTVQTPVYGTVFYANSSLTALYDFSAYTGGVFIRVNSWDNVTGTWSCRIDYATSTVNNTPQSC